MLTQGADWSVEMGERLLKTTNWGKAGKGGYSPGFVSNTVQFEAR